MSRDVLMGLAISAAIVLTGLIGVPLLVRRFSLRRLWDEVEAEAEVYEMQRRRGQLGSVVSVRLTADEHEQLRKIATRDEVGYTAMVRDWIRDRLTRETVAALPDKPPQPWESATWTCPHLNASGPLVSMRCWTCGPLPGPTTITYRVAS